VTKQNIGLDIGPALGPTRAIPILENLVGQGDTLRGTSWDSAERDQWSHTGQAALIAALGRAHPSVQSFGTAQTGVYGPGRSEIFFLNQANRQLDGMIAVLKSAVQQLRWQLPDPTQVFLPAGSPHDAYLEIRKIIQLVVTDVLIVDSYVDGTIWSLLKNIPATAKIRIMTMQMKGDFALEAHKFLRQQGNTVEVRQTAQYHDRFIVVDGLRCWHLGVSIKDAGNKAFAMSEMLSPSILSAVRIDVEATWSKAGIVPV
jgi:hypothetical protein